MPLISSHALSRYTIEPIGSLPSLPSPANRPINPSMARCSVFSAISVSASPLSRQVNGSAPCFQAIFNVSSDIERICSVYFGQIQADYLLTSEWIEQLRLGGHDPFSPLVHRFMIISSGNSNCIHSRPIISCVSRISAKTRGLFLGFQQNERGLSSLLFSSISRLIPPIFRLKYSAWLIRHN